jgi:U4/U6 small nuclear ribonucleoprotein PRP3
MADTISHKRPAEREDGEDSDAKRRKQEMAEKLAKIKAKLARGNPGAAPVIASPATPAATPSNSGPSQSGNGTLSKEEMARRIAEIKARAQARNGGSVAPVVQRPDPDIKAQIAEARAKAALLASQRSAPQPTESSNGVQNARVDHKAPFEPGARDSQASRSSGDSRVNKGGLAADLHSALRSEGFGTNEDQKLSERSGRGGLSVGLHPSLLDNSTLRPTPNQHGHRSGASQKSRPVPKVKSNPYIADEEELKDAQTKGSERKSKALSFFEHGKFIAQGNAQREAAQLEEMKRRIALDARKTQIEEASDRAFVISRPPAIEWWDEAALPDGCTSYEGVDTADVIKNSEVDGRITDLVCHPVLLQPPQEKFLQPVKPLMLTPKEMAKLRRQRRRADMKEEQARIRMGLVPPPPPKVKKSNMMRVLGEQAVKDPTAVEARVNREIAQRQNDHEQANADRALTKEQRLEKLKTQQVGDAAKGLKIAVFRVDDLSSGKHRYQVDVGAKDNALTGVVVMNPTMYLIIVEGGEHSMKKYRKLLNRIKWTENEPPKSGSNPTTFTGTRVEDSSRGKGSKAAEWCNPYHADGTLKDLSSNRCTLVWEGDEAELKYKKWEPRTCETDGEAKDFLKRSGMENMWTLARSK